MDLEVIAGVEPPVDEAAVQAELEGYVTGHAVAHHQPWKITTLGAADWAIRRLAEVDRSVQQYRDEIDLWQAALKRIESAGEWFRERLMEWAIEQRTPQRKTFPLAHGTVATRESKARIEVVDEDAALAWAKESCPSAIKVTEKFLVSEVGLVARIAEYVTCMESINVTTGDVERIPLPAPQPLDQAKLDRLRERLGDEYRVDPVTVPVVVDHDGNRVPGLGVRDASVTATVTPLL